MKAEERDFSRIPYEGPFGRVETVLLDAEDATSFPPTKWRIHRIGKHLYLRKRCSKETVLAHRVICGCKKGDGAVVDHIDGDTLNNTKANLRLVTSKQNVWNRGASSRSGFLGVQEIRPGVFVGKVRNHGEYHYCGSHETAEAAARAVNSKLLALRGEYARLNKID